MRLNFCTLLIRGGILRPHFERTNILSSIFSDTFLYPDLVKFSFWVVAAIKTVTGRLFQFLKMMNGNLTVNLNTEELIL